MTGTTTTYVQCPYCWESIELVVDCSVRRQEYTEDCSVCCRPILLKIRVRGDDEVEVIAQREDE